MNPYYFKTREEWRGWLEENHDKASELWFVYMKKHTGKPTVAYKESLEEALCYGWIDGLMRSIDEEKYARRFTPRKPKSVWSKINKDLAEKLMKQGKMMPAGMKAIEAGKASGQWYKAYDMKEKAVIPADLQRVLEQDDTALVNFRNFTNSIQSRYIYWINAAKRAETRKKRIQQVFEFALENKKPTM